MVSERQEPCTSTYDGLVNPICMESLAPAKLLFGEVEMISGRVAVAQDRMKVPGL